MLVPMSTSLICRKQEDSKEKLFRIKQVQPGMLVERNWLDHCCRKNMEVYMHGEDEVVGASELDLSKWLTYMVS